MNYILDLVIELVWQSIPQHIGIKSLMQKQIILHYINSTSFETDIQ